MAAVFQELDTDGDEGVSISEFSDCFARPGAKDLTVDGTPLDNNGLKQLAHEVDADGDDQITREELSVAFAKESGGQEGACGDTVCSPVNIDHEDVDLFNKEFTVVEQLGLCDVTALQKPSTELNEIDVSCDDQGNATLTVDLKGGLGQEEIKWSKSELWTFACTVDGETCPCRNFQASDVQEWHMRTGDEGCMAMVLAPQGCSDDCEVKNGALVVPPPVCPAPIASIAKQLRGASDCGTGRGLVEQMGQEEFWPVLWVNVKRRRSNFEVLVDSAADFVGATCLCMGLLSVGGVQGIVSLMSSLLLLLQFEVQLGLSDKFVQFAQSFTDITSISQTLFFDVGPLKNVKHLVHHALTAFENNFFPPTGNYLRSMMDSTVREYLRGQMAVVVSGALLPPLLRLEAFFWC